MLKSLLTLAFLPRAFRLPVMIGIGVFAGLGLATAHIARVPSYLSDDPTTCVNCHVMGTAYLTWAHGSHRNVATCNDCHVPHDNVFKQYAFKAEDGLIHATVFTLRREPQVIRLSERAVPVVEANCRRCHGDLVSAIHPRTWEKGDPRCWDCHRETPHGRVNSLSAVPGQMRPTLPNALDDPRRLHVGDRPALDPKDTRHE